MSRVFSQDLLFLDKYHSWEYNTLSSFHWYCGWFLKEQNIKILIPTNYTKCRKYQWTATALRSGFSYLFRSIVHFCTRSLYSECMFFSKIALLKQIRFYKKSVSYLHGFVYRNAEYWLLDCDKTGHLIQCYCLYLVDLNCTVSIVSIPFPCHWPSILTLSNCMFFDTRGSPIFTTEPDSQHISGCLIYLWLTQAIREVWTFHFHSFF